jgi:multicomponent Na+:H+ antiporter subunit G
MMAELVVSLLLLIGGAFATIAAVGILRMPDLLTRIHAATKVGTVGVSALVLAVMFHFGDLSVHTRGVLIIAFFLLTAPVAAHMIGGAAYRKGVPVWPPKHPDEWREDRRKGVDPR